MARLRLTAIAKKAIIDNSPEIKSQLALALGCSEGSINRYLRESDTDDTLTEAAALVVIHNFTGLSFKALLEQVTVKNSVKGSVKIALS